MSRIVTELSLSVRIGVSATLLAAVAFYANVKERLAR